jgi:hypothetical protein
MMRHDIMMLHHARCHTSYPIETWMVLQNTSSGDPKHELGLVALARTLKASVQAAAITVKPDGATPDASCSLPRPDLPQ